MQDFKILPEHLGKMMLKIEGVNKFKKPIDLLMKDFQTAKLTYVNRLGMLR
jgi:hypothetical protein